MKNNFLNILNQLKESKSPYIKDLKFNSKYAAITYHELDLNLLREEEILPSDIKVSLDFETVLDTLFDDEWNTKQKKNLDKCIYLELIKTKPNAPRGTGSELIVSSLDDMKLKNSIVCLFASPIAPNKKDTYSEEETAIYLPKLMAVYARLGFKEAKGNKQVMFKYA